jgi:hypothetical protein
MLSYKRPHGSESETTFITRFIDTVPGMTQDAFGNRILKLGYSTTLFSCHTDTVHRHPGTQKLLYDTALEVVYKDDDEPLGADNAAGVWVLLQMIQAQVPGLYIFHRGEECGGIGSHYIANQTPELLEDINRAVAFDRRGRHDIITHQAGGRCCSDIFALALADELRLGHKPSSMGIFTDTANYTNLIPECTNVSVGYEHEHTANEMLDLEYLELLAQSAIAVDWEGLATQRDPAQGDFYGDDWYDFVLTYPETAAALLRRYKPSEEDIEKAHYEADRYEDDLDSNWKW